MTLDSEKEKKTFVSKLENNHTYSLTINPEEQYHEHPSRIIQWHDSVLKFIKHSKLDKFSNFRLISEISFPLTNGVDGKSPKKILSRLHLHGTIIFTDVISFFIYTQPKLAMFSIYEIDTIGSAETWENYLTKDKILWNSFRCPFFEYEITNQITKHIKVKPKRRAVDYGLSDDEPENIESSTDINAWIVTRKK